MGCGGIFMMRFSCIAFFVDAGCAEKDNLPMFRRRSLFSAVMVPLIVGVAGLAHLMSQPRFAAYRAVDVVQMTGSGLCFGIAFFALVLLLPRVVSEPAHFARQRWVETASKAD